MSTNIAPDHVSAFEALTAGRYENIALFSCFLNGAPASAIVTVSPPQDDDGAYVVIPLFVRVTDTMIATDHEGTSA